MDGVHFMTGRAQVVERPGGNILAELDLHAGRSGKMLELLALEAFEVRPQSWPAPFA